MLVLALELDGRGTLLSHVNYKRAGQPTSQPQMRVFPLGTTPSLGMSERQRPCLEWLDTQPFHYFSFKGKRGMYLPTKPTESPLNVGCTPNQNLDMKRKSAKRHLEGPRGIHGALMIECGSLQGLRLLPASCKQGCSRVQPKHSIPERPGGCFCLKANGSSAATLF